MGNSKLTDAQLDQAKKMYMDYVSMPKIASIIGVNKSAISYHVQKYWKSERVLRANEMLLEFSDSKIAMMSNTFSDSYRSIKEWVRVKSRDPSQLTPHEIKTMMAIISEMDKITRLDAGSPTDIIESTAPVDVIEVRKKIVQADPFLEEADYRELTSEETTNEIIEDKTEDSEANTSS